MDKIKACVALWGAGSLDPQCPFPQTVPGVISPSPILVSDLIDEGSRIWWMNLLQTLFPIYIVEEIKRIQIPQQEEESFCMVTLYDRVLYYEVSI